MQRFSISPSGSPAIHSRSGASAAAAAASNVKELRAVKLFPPFPPPPRALVSFASNVTTVLALLPRHGRRKKEEADCEGHALYRGNLQREEEG